MDVTLLQQLRERDPQEIVLPTNAESILGYYHEEAVNNSFAMSVLFNGSTRQDDSFDRKYTIGSRTKGMAVGVDIDSPAVPILRDAGKEVESGSLSVKQSDNFMASDLAHIIRVANQTCTEAEVNKVRDNYLDMLRDMAIRNVRSKSNFIWTGAVNGVAELPMADGNVKMIETNTIQLPDATGTAQWTDHASSDILATLTEMEQENIGKGLRMGTVYMNEATYQHMIQNENLINMHGTPVIKDIDRPWGRTETILGRFTVGVTDEGYTDANGNPVKYLADGQLLAVFEGNVARIEHFELPNLDKNHNEDPNLAYSYGGRFTTALGGNPRRDSYFHTDYFAYDFVNPDAFVSKKVF